MPVLDGDEEQGDRVDPPSPPEEQRHLRAIGRVLVARQRLRERAHEVVPREEHGAPRRLGVGPLPLGERGLDHRDPCGLVAPRGQRLHHGDAHVDLALGGQRLAHQQHRLAPLGGREDRHGARGRADAERAGFGPAVAERALQALEGRLRRGGRTYGCGSEDDAHREAEREREAGDDRSGRGDHRSFAPPATLAYASSTTRCTASSFSATRSWSSRRRAASPPMLPSAVATRLRSAGSPPT